MLGKVDSDIKSALLSGDREHADILKLLKNSLNVAAKDKGEELTESEALEVVRKEIKVRKEAAEGFAKAGSAENEASELKELEIISSYLPEQMSAEDLKVEVDKYISANSVELEMKNMGSIIAGVNVIVGDKSSRSDIALVVKDIIQKA